MKGFLGKAKIPIAILSLVLLTIFVVKISLPSIADSGSAVVWTTDAEGNNKYDFEPGDMVYIHGTGFNPDSQIVITLTRPDQTAEACNAISCNPRFLGGLQTSDAEGDFVYIYDLDGIVGEYKVSVSDGINSVNDFIFTDSRTITSATLNGGSSVSVPPSTSITAAVTVQTTGSGTDNDWKSTRYRIEGGSWTCVDTPDHTSSGTNTESFQITAPSSAGVYDVNFRAYSDNSCSSGESSTYTLTDGITVTSPDVCGNGNQQPPEVCDDGNTVNCDGCKGDCTRYDDVCGDGIIECGEGCDDHNTNSNDGCSSICQVETGWTCSGAPSVCKTINPTLPSSCGIDMVLVIDSSGSISSTELAQMKTAFNGFVDAFLPNTPTQIAIVEFDSLGSLTQDYTSNVNDIKSAINSATSGGTTNWQDALKESYDEFDNRVDKPDLYVFASDGNPNTIGDTSPTSVSESVALAAAVVKANQIKLSGIRIITLGIGDQLNPANLIAISSADAYYSSGFDTLADTLAALADDLCGGTITVKKLVDGQPASGWTFSTTVTGGTSNPTSSTTGLDGFINPVFDIDVSDTTATVDVTETSQGGYGFSSAHCYKDNQEVGTPGQGTVTGIDIGKNDAIYCEFQNSLHQCDDDSDCPQDYYTCDGNEIMKHDSYCDQNDYTCKESVGLIEDCDKYNQNTCDGTWWVQQTGTCVNGQAQCNLASSSADCNDGLYCNGEETCDAGECFQGTPITCNDAPQCMLNPGACDDNLDKCVYQLSPDGTSCDDGNLCTEPDTCTQGTCDGPAKNCDDGDECTADSCDPFKGCINQFSDIIGPFTNNVVIEPTYNNGIFDVNATTEDKCSPVKTANYFLGHIYASCDGVPAGTIYPRDDGTFDLDKLKEELGKKNVNYFADGLNWICVQAQDKVNNWGNCECAYFETDILPPDCAYDIYLDKTLYPNEYLICGNNAWLNATVCDQQSKIQGGEYFVDLNIPPVPAPWSGIWLNTLYNFTRGDGWHCSILGAFVNASKLEDGTHYVRLRGKDTAENWGKISECQYVSFVKDTLPPITTKTLIPYDDKKVDCHGYEVGESSATQPTDGCYYVKAGTQVTLHATDPDPQKTGEHADKTRIHWKVYYKVNAGDQWTLDQQGVGDENQDVTITLNKDSYHLIEYWSVDGCGWEEAHHFELDIVDSKPPISTKNIIGPQYNDIEAGKFYIDGVTRIELTCEDQQPHPVNDVKIYYRYRIDDGAWPVDFTLYTGEFGFPEESKHELEYYCADALGNEETHKFEIDYVDKNAPVTTKTYGQPLVDTQGGYPKWINSSTVITLTAEDNVGVCQSGVKDLYYRYIQVNPEYCADQTLCQSYGETIQKQYDKASPMLFGQFTFTIPEESCHLIEYYAVDNVEKTETVKRQCIYVENTPPVTTKSVGEPKKQVDCSTLEQGDYTDGCYYVNSSTPIDLTCTDQQPHPVQMVSIFYKMDWKNESSDAWQEGAWNYQGAGTLSLNFLLENDSYHRFTWYCVDALGNREQEHTELDIVDTQPPVSQKTMGDPKHACLPEEQTLYYPQLPSPTDGCYFITQQTPITITCQDGEPHPVDNVKIYYRDYLYDSNDCVNGCLAVAQVDGIDEWTVVENYTVTIQKNEDSAHILEWYCEDALGNKEDTHTEYDIVDTQPPATTKNVGDPKIDLQCNSMLTNPGFETGDLTGWTVEAEPDIVAVTAADSFTTPYKGTYMVRLGADHYGGSQQIGDNVISQVFTVTEPVLSFAYNIFTYDYKGFNHFGYKVETYPAGNVVYNYDQGAWGSGTNLKNTGWRVVTLDLSGYVGQQVKITFKSGGTSDSSYPTWTYVDCASPGYWITNQTSIELRCADLDPHPVDHVTLYAKYKVDDGQWIDLQTENGYAQLTFSEDSNHILQWYCVDTLGNSEQTNYEWDRVDSTPPTTTKTYGTPLVDTDGGYPKWITSQTPITLTAIDGGEICAVNNVKTYWMNTLVENSYCENQATCLPVHAYDDQNWNRYVEPFSKDEDSCHMIEYWSEDELGNREQIKAQCIFVDNKPPVVDKSIGEPKVPFVTTTPIQFMDQYDVVDPMWYVNQSTSITLSCADQMPHPVDDVKIYYKYYNDGQLVQDWALYTDSFTYGEDTYHELYYYCVDALGNKGPTHVEYDVVDSQPPISQKAFDGLNIPCSQLPCAASGECDYYINKDTEIILRCSDQDPHPVNDVKIYYRYFVDDVIHQDWTEYEGPIQYNEDSIHALEWYCVDALGNREQTHTQIERVDTTPPETTKTVGDPKWGEDDYWVTSHTPITLVTNDKEAICASGPATLYYEDWWDSNCDGTVDQLKQSGSIQVDQNCNLNVTLYLDGECLHELKWHAVDALGNVEEEHTQLHKVDNTPPHVLILKPVDGWYSDGEDIPIVSIAEDLDSKNSPCGHDCDPLGKQCAVGIEDGTQCYAYLLDFLPQPKIVQLETEGTFLYNSDAHECQGYATIPQESGLPDGIVILLVRAKDNLGNEAGSFSEILRTILENCGCHQYNLCAPKCVKDTIQDIVTIWNLPKIGIDNNPIDVEITAPKGGTILNGVPFFFSADISDAQNGEITSGITSGTPCYVSLAGVSIGTVPYRNEERKCSGTVSVPNGIPQGDQELKVEIADNAGNIGFGLISVIVDSVPPTPVTVWKDATKESLYYDTNGHYHLYWEGGEDVNFDHYELFEDDLSLYTGSDTTFVFNDKEDGTYTYFVRSFDKAWSTKSNMITVIVDSQNPVVEITGTTGGLGFFIASYSVTDPDPSSGIDRIVPASDGFALCSGTLPTGFCTVFMGTQLDLTAYDKAGNEGFASTTGTEKDITPPTIIYTNPSGVINYNNIILESNTNEPSTCYYGEQDDFATMTLMSADVGKTNHTANLGTLLDGLHVYHVMCKDLSGNMMDSSKTIVFYIDTTGNCKYVIPDYGHYWSVGWNTFYLPKLVLDDIYGEGPYPVQDILSSLYNESTPNFDVIWYYDGAEWLYFDPLYPEYSTLKFFNDEKSLPYYIKMNEEGRLELNCPKEGECVSQRTYTLDADFDEGTLVGLEHNTVHDQLQLIEGEVTTYPVMWVANAGEDTVSKWDTTNDKEMARYATWFWNGVTRNSHGAWDGPAPSRTAVDIEGNVYVANRHFDNYPADVIKILADDWIDRDSDGVMDTSNDTNGNGVIEISETLPLVDTNFNGRIDPEEIKDERIAWVATVGAGGALGRSLAIDMDGNIWLGLYNTHQYYKLSSVDGSVLAGPIDVSPSTPYGALVDKNGILWGAGLGCYLLKLNTNTLEVENYYECTSETGYSSNYGIALGYDGQGNTQVYLGGTSYTYAQFNSATETFSIPAETHHYTNGIATDKDGNIVAGFYGGAAKYAPDGSLIWEKSSQNFYDARGTVVDSNNDVWVISVDYSKMTKYNGVDGTKLGEFDTGLYPYTYSDAAGLGLRTSTRVGKWNVIFDTKAVDTIFNTVSWTESKPEETDVTVKVRSSNDAATWSPWETATSGITLSSTPAGKYLEIDTTMKSLTEEASPILYDLTVDGTCDGQSLPS